MKAQAARSLVAVLLSLALTAGACARRGSHAAALSDQQFRSVIETFSEPSRRFGISDNFVSNEPRLAENARWLRSAGGVYIGVGPEQNFTYIARVRPAVAFIVDIRRENANLQLLYKALFEICNGRPEFVSRLFSRPLPSGAVADASAEAIFDRIDPVAPSDALRAETMAAVRDRLRTGHGLVLTDADLTDIDRALKAFADGGPSMHFWGSRPVDRNSVRPSYRRLMTMPDFSGEAKSFLATEDAFQFVKDLESRNLIVPIVGDLSGTGAMPRLTAYLREHHHEMTAFYASNVGAYLTNQQTRAFCGNLAALPAAADAWFIDSDSVRTLASKLKSCGR